VALHQAQVRVVGWMCGIEVEDGVLSGGLRRRLGLGGMV